MRVYKTTIAMTFYTAVDDIVEAWGPRASDIEKHLELVNETVEDVLRHQISTARDTNEAGWEPHALPAEFESKFEIVDIPDDRIQRIETYYRSDGAGGIERETRPSDEFITQDIEKLGE